MWGGVCVSMSVCLRLCVCLCEISNCARTNSPVCTSGATGTVAVYTSASCTFTVASSRILVLYKYSVPVLALLVYRYCTCTLPIKCTGRILEYRYDTRTVQVSHIIISYTLGILVLPLLNTVIHMGDRQIIIVTFAIT